MFHDVFEAHADVHPLRLHIAPLSIASIGEPENSPLIVSYKRPFKARAHWSQALHIMLFLNPHVA